MHSLLEASPRTVTKIIQRLKLSCFECGWNECVGDIHHILPLSKGGKDNHENLTYLCPNCHRKAHQDKLLTFRNLFDVVGESWKDHYNVSPLKKKKREFTGKQEQPISLQEALEKGRAAKTKKADEKAAVNIKKLREANIDFTKYGWMRKAAEILDITDQSVKRYLKSRAPDLLEGAKLRQRMPTIADDFVCKTPVRRKNAYKLEKDGRIKTVATPEVQMYLDNGWNRAE